MAGFRDVHIPHHEPPRCDARDRMFHLRRIAIRRGRDGQANQDSVSNGLGLAPADTSQLLRNTSSAVLGLASCKWPPDVPLEDDLHSLE